MRFKPVPEPPAERTVLATIQRALPATAGDVDDCCRLLLAETALETRDEAATWLTFLRALELATEEPAGFRRRDAGSGSALDSDRLRRAFRARVDGADAVLGVLERADGPLTADEVAEAIRSERRQSGDRDRRPTRSVETQRERIERLLEWAALLELAEQERDGYRIAPARE
ncbi:hypothetical protein [Natrinema salsiterrestre]|uniref:Uncharacterized protein n=1 Tax=Natrinema salsiterrestre TaxID=2950540 RepID=A0A9Q4PZ72_9EURY|nr:hypothetical protein [Natrinema salsiterrestre]MDF9744315.1 hypothetical protein [Natrinema salsiterrestre]